MAMQQYSWPGNIRALRHAIERAMILSEGKNLEAIDFQLEIIDNKNIIESNTYKTYLKYNVKEKTENLYLEDLEKRTITKAHKRHQYNISHSAKELGLTRAALYRRMEKHGL